MKKLTYLLFLAIGVTACSVESMDSTENLLTADAKFKVASINTEMKFEDQVCAGVETTITVNFPQRTNSQDKNLPTNIKVDLMVAGEWVEIYQDNLNDVTTTSFNYTFPDHIDYTLRYSAENGPWNPNQILSVQDCSDCEESFSYLANEDGTYTFTYVPAEDMTDVNVEFTFAQGVATSGYNWSNWNGNSATRSETMDLDACETYSWTVGITPNCDSPNSNVWTDFKVGGVSKKNTSTSTPTIVKPCN